MKPGVFALVLGMAALFAPAAFAHHSFAMYKARVEPLRSPER